MPSHVYGGLRYVLCRNAVRCKLCGETIESRHVHDFKTCACKSASVDGGLSYIRIGGNSKDMEPRFMWKTEGKCSVMWLPEEEVIRLWSSTVQDVKRGEETKD